jgi:hypothetical protein
MISRFRRFSGFAAALAALSPCLWADATVKYHTDIQALQGTAVSVPLNQALGGLGDMVIRIKGNKAYTSQGSLASIMDLMTQELTLVDAPHKRFASAPASKYTEQMKAAVPAVPAQAREIFASMKSNLESRSTGRTEVIQGVQAEEREFVMTLDMAMPGGPPTPGPFMKIVMQVWSPKADEGQRVAALQELKNYTASATVAMNPAEMIKQIAGGLPGFGDNLAALVKESTANGGVALRTHMEIVMPFLALMSRQLPQQPGQPLSGLDPNAPLMQMTQEVVELSTDPIDDALFTVPAEYQPASLEEILNGMIPAARPASPAPVAQ